jgi:serine protease Do
MPAGTCRALGHKAISSVQAHDLPTKEKTIMSNNVLRLRLVAGALYLIVFCQGFTLSAATCAGNITGTWEQTHFASYTSHKQVRQIVGRRGVLIDSIADQLQTERGMPYGDLVLMMAGIASPPEKLTVSLNDSKVTLSDSTGASLTLHTDGRLEEFLGGVQVITRCVNDTLVITTVSPQMSAKMSFTTARGGALLVVSETDFPEVGIVVTRYSYDYQSGDQAFSTSFWQLHSPVYHRDQERMEELAHKSDVLLDQINKKIAKTSNSSRGIPSSLQLVLNNRPAPPSPIKPSLSNDMSDQPPDYGSNPLRAFDSELRALTDRVSPAVVQILVDRYGSGESENPGQAALVTEKRSVASGVILDPSGYIITNAHVVKGAWRVRVILTKAEEHSDVLPTPMTEESAVLATIVGGTDHFDLALLKIDASNLPSLSFADFRKVGQGQIVVAIGSPLGLSNSVTMGVISSVARQANPNSALVYVQTDAPINPGNSGGALVDVNGFLVGINTSIMSQSGGSEGVGFALPASTVKMVYDNLRIRGHVGRRTIGAGIQVITPVLAKGLGLGSTNGLVICDVLPGSPGEQSGLKIGDVVAEVDGRPISTAPELEGALYGHDLNQALSLTVMRGSARLRLQVKIVEAEDWTHSVIGQVDPSDNFIQQLGVIAATLTSNLAEGIEDVRFSSGVVVIGRTSNSSRLDLSTGDIIHSINGQTVGNVKVLRELVAQFKPGEPVVLLVERQGGLGFVSFEID